MFWPNRIRDCRLSCGFRSFCLLSRRVRIFWIGLRCSVCVYLQFPIVIGVLIQVCDQSQSAFRSAGLSRPISPTLSRCATASLLLRVVCVPSMHIYRAYSSTTPLPTSSSSYACVGLVMCAVRCVPYTHPREPVDCWRKSATRRPSLVQKKTNASISVGRATLVTLHGKPCAHICTHAHVHSS